MHRTSALVRASIAALAINLVAAPAALASTHDLRSKQQNVQREKAAKAKEVNVLKASDSELEEALDALNGNVRAQEARAASARQAADAAAGEARRARAKEQATAAELATLQASMKDVAVEAYMRGPSQDLAIALDAPSVQALATRQHLVGISASKRAETVDRLRAAREDLQIQREAADAAEKVAAERRKAVDQRFKEAKNALAVQERVASAVEERLDRALAEAASLDALDQQLSAEIRARQARLAARVAARPPAAPRASRSVSRVGSVNLTTVRGITVATEIASNLEGLLAAADGDGLALSGGGYRSSDGQVAARRANCGTSDYAIYEMPPSQCRPPTARPGTSMHERGLAIDFTSGGSLIRSRSDPAFRWLSANASRFGLYNLPEEPWHWSSNGQ